ncbi:MAG: hypothetical protein COB88_10155, partial [Flavobacteriales bacterium]
HLIEIPAHAMSTRNSMELILVNCISTPRICIHSEILLEFQFNKEYTIGEDLDLLTRIVQKYRLIGTGMYTIVYVNHSERSVHINNLNCFTEHIDRIREIIHRDNNSMISKKIQKTALSNAYFNLGGHYAHMHQNLKASSAILRSLLIFPTYRWKEKLYIILSTSLLTK